MTKHYSVKTGGFYPAEMRADYDAAGSWPADAVELSDADEILIRDCLSTGGTISRTAGEWITAPAPPPTDAQLIDAAKAKRDALLANAADAIAPLQDAVDLDVATQEEIGLLTKWKQYRVDVNRIQNLPQYPRAIAWPVPPAS
ncbi:tail fiber assembly protein [Collimonas sp. H4R21]|uniref:Tail fiber assembly protein n=1 Tax=Collimonas rhizosphaerae TaxID=3126357 RepID=A0ABU9PXV1_9BURK